MNSIQIKRWDNDKVICEGGHRSLGDAVEYCAKEGISLSNADLSNADLRNADLHDGFKCDGNHHHITNVGSENGILELYSCGESGWFVKRGCFSGSKQEFLDAVTETHEDNEHAVKYRKIIELFCGV